MLVHVVLSASVALHSSALSEPLVIGMQRESKNISIGCLSDTDEY